MIGVKVTSEERKENRRNLFTTDRFNFLVSRSEPVEQISNDNSSKSRATSAGIRKQRRSLPGASAKVVARQRCTSVPSVKPPIPSFKSQLSRASTGTSASTFGNKKLDFVGFSKRSSW